MTSDYPLTPLEIRVIGALIEKEITTPEQYPLSLNALTNACNQKSNREPVMSLTEAEVQQTLDSLAKKHITTECSSFGSRVPKYKHRFCNTEFSELQLTAQELGIMCVLFLRGPQTPGELRTRAERLCHFDDVQSVETTLQKLIEHPSHPLVARLPREPGKREIRYIHLLGGEVKIDPAVPLSVSESANSDRERITALEEQMELMQLEIELLKESLEYLTSQISGKVLINQKSES